MHMEVHKHTRNISVNSNIIYICVFWTVFNAVVSWISECVQSVTLISWGTEFLRCSTGKRVMPRMAEDIFPKHFKRIFLKPRVSDSSATCARKHLKTNHFPHYLFTKFSLFKEKVIYPENVHIYYVYIVLSKAVFFLTILYALTDVGR